MSQWNTRLDEEQQVEHLHDMAIRHKNMLEQQRAMYGPLNMPPYLQIEIEYYEEEIERLNKSLGTVRRRKKRQQRVQQTLGVVRSVAHLEDGSSGYVKDRYLAQP
jgi:hypothetical protein